MYPLSTAFNDVSDYAQVRFVTHLKTIAITLVLNALDLSECGITHLALYELFNATM